MPETDDFLTVTDLSLAERGAVALQNISFRQEPGQRLALVGESGAGKSTLLQCIAGLVQPTAGEIRFAGRRVKGPQEVLVPGHPGIVYLSQKSELPHSLRVEQVLRYASKRPAAEAAAVYDVCRITQLLTRRTDELSGGEQQRVALARLLLAAPRMLLLDEPFSNLDRGHKQQMQRIIQEVGEQLAITCLLVSHDSADTLPWADELLVLQQGQLIQQGPPEQVYRQPVNEYAAALLGDYSVVSGPDVRALLAAPRRKLPGTALLVRPENVQLLPTTESGVPAQVQAVRFMGSYYEAEVLLPAGSRLRARSNTAPVIGATVTVQLLASAPVFLSN
ncbi:ABC transporter ATP-binding protein [Hymenobacter endophyticus]|uniref:ABC transporter ATP-binding protein n=1 Tax=Hymenobacter endophyticus TaxID=3076335 RepID=A0ABU3TD75_9BACT|nr:ABC transporter ATP-binding protein [Hymenobacter endophyticus]MDU0369336.1 ABC transporter ATP-binding protein [Hymenobacter endophyticus]